MNMKIKQGRQTVTNKIAYIAGFFESKDILSPSGKELAYRRMRELKK